MANKILIGVLILAMCCFYCGCDRYDSHQDGLAPHVSISPDDREILFSWYKEGIASIYVADANGNNVRHLTTAKEESHINAVYSHDGKNILFLAYQVKSEGPVSQICIMDSNGSNLRKLTSGNEHITEAIYSPGGRTIYYLQSNFFGHYSPITGSRPHKFDIYSLDIDRNETHQLTNMHEYEMFGLSVTSNGQELLFGTYSSNGTEPFHRILINEPNIINSFGGKESYDLGLSPDDKTIAFVMPSNGRRGYIYELYLMDLESKYSRQITNLQRCVHSPCFMHRNPALIFVVEITWPDRPIKYELWSVNSGGTNLSKIDLNMANAK